MLEGVNVPIVAAVAGCGIVGALVDIRTRRVPNPLTLSIAVTGLALAATRWSGLGVATAALGLAVGIALMLLPYVFGAMGGGDVKLFAALGTFLGPWPTVQAFLYTLLAGGLLAVWVAVQRRRLQETVTNAAALVRTAGANAPAIEHPTSNNRFAYAPAIAVGTVAAALGF
jgi:prepilin peptidase CpaA